MGGMNLRVCGDYMLYWGLNMGGMNALDPVILLQFISFSL